ncbi:hypothetical protein AGMMS49965_26550 [Bacteroidia bacterium]|nr:hypothetical protein AGMMS49965_26550 [Bacteroidia bacterium]
MKKFIVLLLFISSIGISGCGENSSEKEKITSLKKKSEKHIIPVQIGQGDLYYGSGREVIPQQGIVIKTQSQWDNLKHAMDEVNNTSNSFLEKEIDFNNYQIIAVFDEVKGNGGWSIDITDIAEYFNTIVVTVKNLKTGDLTSVITQPYHIVKIPASSKEIIFKH